MVGVLVLTGVLVGLLVNWGEDLEAGIVTPTNTEPLFRADGNHNITLARQLYSLAYLADERLSVDGSHYAITARSMLEFMGGELPKFFMLEAGGTTLHDQLFRDMPWRLSYISRPIDGGEPVFTFWAAATYRNATLVNLEARNYLINDFALVSNDFPLLENSIVTPRQLPGEWQSNQPEDPRYFSIENSIPNERLDDSIWLPSHFEIGWNVHGNAGSLGLWDLRHGTQPGGSWHINDRSFVSLDTVTHSHGASAWLRGRAPGGGIWSAMGSGTFGRTSFAAVHSTGVTAALHLRLSHLVGDGFPATFRDENGVVVGSSWIAQNEPIVPPNATGRVGYDLYWSIQGQTQPFTNWNNHGLTSSTTFVVRFRRQPSWFDIMPPT